MVSDVTLDKEFNQKVDIYSLLPILSVPIIVRVGMHSVVIAVLQVTLRERAKFRMKQRMCLAKDVKDYLQDIQFLVEQYADTVRQAYRFVYERLGDHLLTDFEDNGRQTVQALPEEQAAFASFMSDQKEEL